jgi:hypothetical protein
MKNPTFQKFIKKHKQALLDAGLNQYTVRSWAYGYRIPDLRNANVIAHVTGISINEIPYRQIIYNKP